VLSKRAFLKCLAASGAASLSAGLALAGPLRPSAWNAGQSAKLWATPAMTMIRSSSA
jgi:hypothetical protein